MATRENEPARRRFGDLYVIAADQVFDGTRVLEDHGSRSGVIGSRRWHRPTGSPAKAS
jgi:hypothetical protein